MKAIHLTKADFLTKVANYETNPNEWKFLGERPALIDFYATWCGPCKMLAPVLDELAEEYEGKIDIYKIDVDAEEELAALFGIRSVPSHGGFSADGTGGYAQTCAERRYPEGTVECMIERLPVFRTGSQQEIPVNL